jgi:hypothetical protein
MFVIQDTTVHRTHLLKCYVLLDTTAVQAGNGVSHALLVFNASMGQSHRPFVQMERTAHKDQQYAQRVLQATIVLSREPSRHAYALEGNTRQVVRHNALLVQPDLTAQQGQ